MVAACLCGAMAQNNAINIYRTDGDVNTFLKANIDSIRWSHIGIDSIFYNNYVVQEIWTPDSVYRIPIETIESICFVTRCPDGNHPHAIDLGLPSGTKWCCRNVGASFPEYWGGFYAWGETSEKSEYTMDNYAFYDKETFEYKCINIGNEISGTQYDVAHMVMGGSWRMPTREQIVELIKYCTIEWTQLNGANGMLVTGPNGGQIFLPAWSDGFHGEGSGGAYWSGSLYPDNDYGAYVFGFESVLWGCSLKCIWGYRWLCRSVRAVCP